VTLVLHTLNALPSSASFRDCILSAHTDDAIALLGDGVYAALADTPACRELQETGAELFILHADALLAGVRQPAPFIAIIDMEGLVELTERFPRQLAWY
jgi:tRNA 2-thiouridine synthesizing protein B